ncbi:Oxygen-independent coproporphyrinogen-III oxidase-like protein [Rubripirellula lacrimiformis]|uniref:Heme chaperone HemW n=1 Tax=Rubripirellula lacrimiformis TaxID=1930273 RepID=A0A517N7Z7_9BACT|nr:radical SAM family heme chaperone HemW [Rubripirellula lacrimiformis]QDT03251.1 Oxygen-independent coproporphyrinogen-III oxidase-like protein [Rubripirellula lacrimiformis]
MAVDQAELSAFQWPTPTSAYVHVPFCRHRCGYCNFSVLADRDDLMESYLDAVDAELSALESPAVQTVFIGGGTPTHLPIDALDRLLQIVTNRLQLSDDFEWSVEANPEDITDEKLDCLVAHGINRISLGMQSFHDAKLAGLERGHSGAGGAAVIRQVAEVIRNVSIDLIFAAPGETATQWRDDLQMALSLPIQHLSTYALTFEKGTSFWSRRLRGELSAADESVEIDMYQAARQMTADAGLQQYEVSSFAKPAARCRHNLAYWDGLGWYAAGPGAARFVDGRREVNHRSTTTYLKRMRGGLSPVAESDAITVQQYARERAAFGVRQIDGVDLDRIHRETGIDIRGMCADMIQRSTDEQLLEEADGLIRLTQRGVLFADTVAGRFLD